MIAHPSLDARAVIVSGIADRAPLRVHVLDALGIGQGTRAIEGLARELIVGRDGRERVVLELEAGDEPVQIRLLVERILRAERISEASPRPAGPSYRPTPFDSSRAATRPASVVPRLTPSRIETKPISAARNLTPSTISKK